MKTPIFYLIYTSQARNRMSDSDLLKLLEQSRVNNEHHRLTGILLYMEGRFVNKLEGRFIQVLEGDEADVRMIYDRILKDLRNHGIILLKSGSTASRSFPAWTMGFKSLKANEYRNIPGYFELDSGILSNDHFRDSDQPLTFLRSFYTINSAEDER